jgi:hypothetical protein
MRGRGYRGAARGSKVWINPQLAAHDTLKNQAVIPQNYLQPVKEAKNIDNDNPKQTSNDIDTLKSRNERFESAPEDNRFMELKDKREDLAAMYIKAKKMADPNEKYSLGEEPEFIAECWDMCPEFERHEREFQNNLIKFEMVLLN